MLTKRKLEDLLRSDRRAVLDQSVDTGCRRSEGGREVHVHVKVRCVNGSPVDVEGRIEEVVRG